jgi:hypothetical protein
VRIVSGSQSALAFVVAIYITFSQAHHAGVGLIALGSYALLLAISNVVTSAISDRGIGLIEVIPGAVVSLITGVLSFMIFAGGRNLATGFHSLTTAWSLLTASFLIYLAAREGFKTSAGRDQLISGVLSATLALILLVAPLSQIATVGFFGAYLALMAVHLGIAAASPTEPASGHDKKAD